MKCSRCGKEKYAFQKVCSECTGELNMTSWISVKDRLPEDQQEVLVCTRSKNGSRNIDKGYLAIDHFIHRGRAEVTHWMPLPELPEDGTP